VGGGGELGPLQEMAAVLEQQSESALRLVLLCEPEIDQEAHDLALRLRRVDGLVQELVHGRVVLEDLLAVRPGREVQRFRAIEEALDVERGGAHGELLSHDPGWELHLDQWCAAATKPAL